MNQVGIGRQTALQTEARNGGRMSTANLKETVTTAGVRLRRDPADQSIAQIAAPKIGEFAHAAITASGAGIASAAIRSSVAAALAASTRFSATPK